MVASWRQGVVFGTGLALGVLSSVIMLSGYRMEPEAQAATLPASPTAASAYCGFDPLVPARSQVDRFGVPMGASGKQVTDIAAYIAVGQDMASKGRSRDAEIAFITACRIAGPLAGPDSAELADAKFHLAQLYADAPVTGTTRADALTRAESLLSESVSAFGVKLGIAHEKTALAAGGLARVKDALFAAQEPAGVPRELLAERASPDYAVAMVNTAAMGAAAERRAARAASEEETRDRDSDRVLSMPVATSGPAPASPAQPVNVPTCLSGDCPAQTQLLREREREREPIPAMQASRQMTMPPARVEAAPVARVEPAPILQRAPAQATGSATGSAGDPAAP